VKKFIKYTVLSAALALLNTFAYAQTVEEVTVTAARKEQSVQDVAISVQAISNDDIQKQHIETADDLSTTIPGFGFSQAIGSGVGLKIRGLSFETIGAGQTQPGITAQDGHQIFNRSFGTIGFYDAERIEVLEGPQGTLYGRNSTTGLVNFIAAKPGAEQYLNIGAGQDGLSRFSFGRDFDISDTAMLRIAGTKMDRDGVIFNAGTGNDIDDQDSWGLRSTLVVQMDDQNELTFKYERSQIGDSRQNLGSSACNRNAFFGCHPITTNLGDFLNSPVNTGGSVSNTFNILTDINASGSDLFATTVANRVNSIDVINKDIDPYRVENFEMAQVYNVTELDNMTIKLQATYIDGDYYHLDDNDHSNASLPLNGTLIPVGFTIPTLRTYCLGTLTGVTSDRASECSTATGYTEQYEINIVSDFDGMHNFTLGAYDYQSEQVNKYTIQTTAYLLMNDFDQHPYSALFGGALDDHAGQLFYSVFAQTLAGQASNIQTAAAGGQTALVNFLTGTIAPAIRTACAGAAATSAGAGTNATCIKDMPAEAGGLINDQRTGVNSTAVYGEYYFTPTDNFKITLGGRYMDDRFMTKSRNGLSDGAYSSFRSTTPVAACNGLDYEACWTASAQAAGDKNETFTYLVGAQYDYDAGMVYATYKTGNRMGGTQPDATLFGESESTQIEIGSKNVLLGGAMRLNATFFTQEVEDAQWSVIRGNSAYTELHDMTHEGFQVNMQAFVTPSTILTINALQTDSTFDTETSSTGVASAAIGYTFYQGSKSVDPHNPTQATSFTTYTGAQMTGALAPVKTAIDTACGNVPAIANFCSTVGYAVDNNANWFINPTGLVQPMLNSSTMGAVARVMKEIGGNKVPASADLETTIQLTQLYQAMGGSGTVNLSYHYKDETEGDIFNNDRFRTPDQEYVNFNATYEPDNADWYLNLWARNLTDKRYISSVQRTSNLQGANPFITFAQGMKVGLDFGYSF
jgi:outer membrane receptor protein involved in Fe transport